MDKLYIVIENGGLYANSYKTYLAAVKAVVKKHEAYLDSIIADHDGDGLSMYGELYREENRETGRTELSIFGFNISICRYSVATSL